jgi:CBS domain containing-hemolysin-like protein
LNNKFINKLKFFLKKKDNKIQNNFENLLNERLKQEKPLKINEEKIISNVFQLPGKLVNDIMIPRTDIISVDSKLDINKLVKLIGRTSHSRYPVFDKSRDNIVGMIHIKDVISCWENKKIRNIEKLIRKILFAPHSMSVLDLLLKMRTSHIHMAVVVDEHGGLDGLVTIEDLVEVIVGEIKDEHEAQKENKKNKNKLIKDDRGVKINSRMPIEKFEKKYGINFSDKEDINDIDTMGGLVFHIFGRVPLKGESIKHPNGCEFEILDADSRRIRTILVTNHIFE